MEVEAVASAAPALPGGDGAVRVVARICPPSSAATTTAPAPAAGTSLFQVAASRGRRPRASGPGAGAVLSFTPAAAPAPAPAAPTPSSSSQGRPAAGQRKEEHRLDWCYLQDETNHQVFLHELQPILANHLQTQTATTGNACVVACGAAAAKDHLFKGSQEQPGLVTIAMEEILGFAASIGAAVRVSSYQVVQDTHVLDLLEPKEQEVLVLEDAQGKTHLKGLSKVHVKSIEDFARLGCFDENQDKQLPTKASSTQQQPTKPFSTQPQPAKASSTQLQTRGHQGLIIHISSSDQDGKERAVAKINFLSLTDYVDPKQKTGGAAAALSSGNKSMYTLMNVVQALNSNQSFVPYRQSKVTRILQDSLCKTSGAVVIACLEEVSCQDAVSTLSLAARSSQVATQVANEQCRRSASVTSFKRADVNLSAVAKSSSRPILSSTHQPNPVVEKQDRPQWNMSAVKAARTPIANKRSQPTMHPAKKSENSLPTPIKITQKAATPTMSGRPQPIMHSAKNLESSLSTPIKMPPKDAKPTTTSGSALLCPSTNSAKEEAAVIAPATVAEVEEIQSSQGMEIDAPSVDEGFDKTSDALDTVPSEVQKVVSSGMAIDAPSTDEGFDKTSDALDTVSSEIQKVVSSGMEEEDHSSSSLDAASSCTIDSGETCSSNLPGAFVEKTPVKTHMNTPKISDKLREISNSLKLLNARPLSVMAQKVAMEKTQEEGMEKTQKVAMEKTQEVVAMETTQEEGMETTQEVAAVETTQEEGMETTQEVGMETTQEVGMETTQEVATGATQEVAVETAQEVAVEMTREVATGTTQEVAVETTQEVAVETTQEVAAETAQEVAAETAQEVAVQTTQEVATETAQEVAAETTQEVAVQTTQEVAVETAQEVAVEMTQEVATETTQEVAVKTTQEVGIESVQGGTSIDAPEPKTPAMHLKVEQAADPKTPAIHLKFEQAADYPTSSFKTRSTGIKKSIVQECLSFLNSANKEQLKSLKGIGEKRANYIIELRENSPELFKGIDDLRDVIGMNKTEIKKMMAGIINSP
ncbi:kinesin-like protein KIN-10B isoform X3 [Triticum aestivum]|uniref:kinesin-like protein KIN-10B isoform X3 n=1 Tax=Triticum aestivum TaxID=4565 RepID=UPI001D004F95|nr:kinesin-like protein KIN-10B isoform X3 [Triticum aestivum]